MRLTLHSATSRESEQALTRLQLGSDLLLSLILELCCEVRLSLINILLLHNRAVIGVFSPSEGRGIGDKGGEGGRIPNNGGKVIGAIYNSGRDIPLAPPLLDTRRDRSSMLR